MGHLSVNHISQQWLSLVNTRTRNGQNGGHINRTSYTRRRQPNFYDNNTTLNPRHRRPLSLNLRLNQRQHRQHIATRIGQRITTSYGGATIRLYTHQAHLNANNSILKPRPNVERALSRMLNGHRQINGNPILNLRR